MSSTRSASPYPLCPASVPPSGRMVPGGSVNSTPGSREAVAFTVEQPRMFQLLALAVQAVGHAVGGERRGNVDEHRIAFGRESDRERIGREHGARAAEGRDAGRVGIGAHQNHHHALIGRAPEIRGEARDVMAAADRDHAGAVLARLFPRIFHGAQHQPRAGKALAVPGGAGAALVHHFIFARARHAAAFDFGEIRRQQRQAVGIVAQQIAFDQDVRDVARDFGIEPGVRQQVGGKGDQLARGIALCAHLPARALSRAW